MNFEKYFYNQNLDNLADKLMDGMGDDLTDAEYEITTAYVECIDNGYEDFIVNGLLSDDIDDLKEARKILRSSGVDRLIVKGKRFEDIVSYLDAGFKVKGPYHNKITRQNAFSREEQIDGIILTA